MLTKPASKYQTLQSIAEKLCNVVIWKMFLKFTAENKVVTMRYLVILDGCIKIYFQTNNNNSPWECSSGHTTAQWVRGRLQMSLLILSEFRQIN